MCELRDLLLRERVDAPQDVRMLLLYAGIAVNRRVALGDEGEELGDLRVSMALLLVLQVLCDHRGRNPTPSPTQTGGRAATSPSLLIHPLQPHEEGIQDVDPVASRPVERRGDSTLQTWRTTPLKTIIRMADLDTDEALDLLKRVDPGAVCRACVAESPRLTELPKLVEAAAVFFRCSSFALQHSMLDAQEPRDARESNFLTLGVANVMAAANLDMREAKLQAIVDTAEAEVGQQILRDLILSFTLPPAVVGVRRAPLLGREANRIATEHHAPTLGAAHDCAMRGSEWTWQHDECTIHKMCALLAGLGIQLAGKGGTAENVRKSDAFGGRVTLPFLETSPPPPGVSRLGFVPHRNEWLVYSIDRKGAPTVQLKHTGFEGLCVAVLALTS
jgi:hypothetical protein